MTLPTNVFNTPRDKTQVSTSVDHRGEGIPRQQLSPSTALVPERSLPSWVKEQMHQWGEPFCLPEWDDDEDVDEENDVDTYRSSHGWKGRDLCHSKSSPVRISHYAIQYADGGVGTTLTGIAHFTTQAESHAGYCHGGSMTSVMDDIVGWTAFHVTGSCLAWSGFTAQINVSLKQPIAVGTCLKIVGKVVGWEGRKVWVDASLLDVQEDDNESIHCTAEGLVILKRGH
ncbi:hypothetical protein ACHAW6_007744 [Cyclotella cf. meneghiniana]